MPPFSKHAPGEFSWIELGVKDQNAAKPFYTSLFGWTFTDLPMGPNDVYTMFKLGAENVAAAYTLRAPDLATGIPPHWNLYVAVDSAGDAAEKAAALGGKVLEGPFDVFEAGRMAVIQDPAGAVTSVWQAKKNTGLGMKGENGSLCWADLHTPDQQGAAAFYAALFGWQMEAGHEASGYIHIKNGENYIGGVPPANRRDPNARPGWLIYIQVSDCDAATDKAKQLGAHVYFGPVTMEKVGRMTILADPQGAVFSLFQPLPR